MVSPRRAASSALCWSELTTRDPERAKAFYTSLFGWTAKDSSADAGGMEYTEFSNQGQPLFVFFCLWETGHRDAAASGLSQAYTRRNLLERVRIGQRNLGQQSVEVIVSGLASAEAAAAEFRHVAPQLFQPSS